MVVVVAVAAAAAAAAVVVVVVVIIADIELFEEVSLSSTIAVGVSGLGMPRGDAAAPCGELRGNVHGWQGRTDACFWVHGCGTSICEVL